MLACPLAKGFLACLGLAFMSKFPSFFSSSKNSREEGAVAHVRRPHKSGCNSRFLQIVVLERVFKSYV